MKMAAGICDAYPDSFGHHLDASSPVEDAPTATQKYPANSLSPIARPRCLGPARSIFMPTQRKS